MNQHVNHPELLDRNQAQGKVWLTDTSDQSIHCNGHGLAWLHRVDEKCAGQIDSS
jgi:hypothetical protein